MLMDRKKITLAILFAVVIISMAFSFAFAQDRPLEVTYPDIASGATAPTTTNTGLPGYVKYVFNFVVGLAAIILLYAIIKGGFMYLTATGNITAMTAARKQISSAILGIIILLGSYIILTTINPQLTILNIPILNNIIGGTPQCNDGEDNDNDGKIDMADPGCSNQNDRSEIDTDTTNSIIYHEIPIGQMIKGGIWKPDIVTSMTNENATGLLDEFEKFLTDEITAGGKTSKSISGMNKYLKSLAETCNCDKLKPICTKPKDFTLDVGCAGDPCEKNRDKIQEILNTNSSVIKTIDQKFKKDLVAKLNEIFTEQDEFYGEQTRLHECLETGFIMTQGDYLQSIRFYEEQGIDTELVPSYVPSRGDPFTFYCTVGGTTFDMPSRPSEEPPLPGSSELELPPGITEEYSQLSCPGFIPVGEIMDVSLIGSYEQSDNVDALIAYIDELAGEIKNMADLVGQCNEKSCKGSKDTTSNCKCFPNPCYLNPLCGPKAAVPCLKPSPGTCEAKNDDPRFNGSACPLYKDPNDPNVLSIEGTVEKIKWVEDQLLDIIQELKSNLNNPPFIVESPQQIPTDVISSINWVSSFCKNDNIEEPKWAMMNCGLAIGQIGPDGKEIKDCDPQSFFCCTQDSNLAKSLTGQGPSGTSGATSYQNATPFSAPLTSYGPGYDHGVAIRTSEPPGKSAALGYVNPTGSECGSGCESVQSRLVNINFMGKNIQIHEAAKEAFEAVAADIQASGLTYFNSWSNGGTFCCRKVRGGSSPSPHSWATAIDINVPSPVVCPPPWKPNCFSSTRPSFPCPTDMPEELINIFKRHNFRWGGNFTRRCDAMHLEWLGW